MPPVLAPNVHTIERRSLVTRLRNQPNLHRGHCLRRLHCQGNTYANECEMRRKSCANEEIDLRPLFYGECDDLNDVVDEGHAGDDVGSGDVDERRPH